MNVLIVYCIWRFRVHNLYLLIILRGFFYYFCEINFNEISLWNRLQKIFKFLSSQKIHLCPIVNVGSLNSYKCDFLYNSTSNRTFKIET